MYLCHVSVRALMDILGGFLFLAIVNRATINMDEQVSSLRNIESLGACPGLIQLAHMVVLF